MNRRTDRLLRWYPAAWRARYGQELVTLLEDSYGDGPVPLRQRLSLARHGLSERARHSGLADGADAGQRARSGALLVLCSWSAFVAAGASFAKYVEHWDAATPAAARWLPAAAYDVVVGAALVGAATIGVGAVVALPALFSFLGTGRWRELRRPVAVAVALSAVTAGMTVGAVLWGHAQNGSGRISGWLPGLGLGGLFALSFGATLAAWCTAAVSMVRRLELSPRLLRIEGALAVVLFGVMFGVTAGTVTWWASMATTAPRFLSHGLLGAWGPGVAPVLVGTGLLMVAGLVAATAGAWRVVRALASLDS